ncbi:MAG: discoidin domain-containing protein [Methylocella sp.]
MYSKLFGTIFILLMLSTASANAQCAASGSIDISIFKPTAVSSFTPTNPGRYAVDGNFGTYWQSSGGNFQWLVVDMGREYGLTELAGIWNGSQFPKIGEVDASADATRWDGMFEIGGLTSFDVHFPTTTGESATKLYRYVRVALLATESGSYALNELKVCGFVRN